MPNHDRIQRFKRAIRSLTVELLNMSDLFFVPNRGRPTSSYISTGVDHRPTAGPAGSVRDTLKYSHSFGGPPRHTGVIAKGATKPLQLYYNLDTTDPNCQIKIPGCRWLPLYSATRFQGSSLSYRIVSDTEIEILHLTSTKCVRNYPLDIL